MPQSSAMSTAIDIDTHLQATLVEVTDLDDLGEMWIDLEPRSEGSYFTSWGWIGTWLRHVPRELRPQALLIEDGHGVRGMGLVNRRHIFRKRIIHSNALFLNETGHPTYDELTMEYNGLRVDRECAEVAILAALGWLTEEAGAWDEFFISGVEADSQLERILREMDVGVECRVLKEHPCFQIPLETLRASGTDFLSTLSSNTRQKVRKAIRLYEAQGNLTLECARTATEAVEFYDRLKSLHEAHWIERGEAGAFPPMCDAFHRDLIEHRFDTGEIQLLKITAGGGGSGLLVQLLVRGAGLLLPERTCLQRRSQAETGARQPLAGSPVQSGGRGGDLRLHGRRPSPQAEPGR